MKRLIFPLIASALVLYLHVIGLEYFLYFHYWWYDILLHFLGGVALGFFVLIFTKSWKKTIIGMLILAAGWEVFEYFLNIAVGLGENYPLDTVVDFIMDTLGAFVAIFISKK
jgi:VanZ family protein